MMDVMVEKFEVFYGNYPTGDLIYKVRRIPGGQVLNSFYVEYDSDRDTHKKNIAEMIKVIKKYIKENEMNLLYPIN